MRLSGRELAPQPGSSAKLIRSAYGAGSASIPAALVAPGVPRSEGGLPPTAVVLYSRCTVLATPLHRSGPAACCVLSTYTSTVSHRWPRHNVISPPGHSMDDIPHLVEQGPIEMHWILISRLNNPSLPSFGAMSALSLPTGAAGGTEVRTHPAMIKKSSSGFFSPSCFAPAVLFVCILSVCIVSSSDHPEHVRFRFVVLPWEIIACS